MKTPSSPKATILLVEDEAPVQALISAVLRGAGYAVHQAFTAEDAEKNALLHGASIDLLITDEVIPGYSGVELAARMKGARPDLKVICISGFLKEDVVKEEGG